MTDTGPFNELLFLISLAAVVDTHDDDGSGDRPEAAYADVHPAVEQQSQSWLITGSTSAGTSLC
jgi:hypothetical protein